MDTGESHRVRWAAAKQAERERFASPRRVAALTKMVWKPGFPAKYSRYAVDQLVAIDATQARGRLAEALLKTPDRPTIEHIAGTAVERNWTEFTPALVRRWARPIRRGKQEPRPEAKALRSLHPGRTLDEVLTNVLTDTRLDVRSRVAAWRLLARRSGGRAERIRRLRKLDARDPLIEDLQAAARLGVVPRRLSTVLWLQTLRSKARRPFWKRAKKAVGRLDAARRSGLALRHLPVLVYLDRHAPSRLRQERATLVRRLEARLAKAAHHVPDASRTAPPQAFREHEPSLVWADLLAIQLFVDHLDDRRLVGAWFAQADDDREDESTELGGLLRADDAGRLRPDLYKPAERKHDRIYLPPPTLFLDAYTALAHYHFHAQRTDNAEHAGPGGADRRRIAGHHRLTGLVLTCVGRDRLNVDYYQPGDVVVDLGTVRRPP